MTFDDASEKRLAKCDARLAGVLREAADHTRFAWRIVQTDRTVEQQRAYFAAGRSKVNPDAYSDLATLYRKAKHITGPGMPFSRAVDVCIVGGDPYNLKALQELADVIKTVAEARGVDVRWGGDFDRDGVAYEKGTFIDAPHFELM